MNVKQVFLLVMFLYGCSNITFAQSASLEESIDINQFTTSTESEIFFFDSEGSICFIDFANFNVNINAVSIYDPAGNQLLSEEVWDLPVNSIYEVDTSKFRSGTYTLVLNTFKGNIRKDIRIK